MIHQTEVKLPEFSRGYHLITNHLSAYLTDLPEKGLVNIFIQHTSAGLTLNENADPTVRDDFETMVNRLVPENQAGLRHTLEGSDDMPSHLKSSLVGASLTIPVSEGRLNLGTWQGIYLCEFRDYGGPRRLVITTYC